MSTIRADQAEAGKTYRYKQRANDLGNEVYVEEVRHGVTDATVFIHGAFFLDGEPVGTGEGLFLAADELVELLGGDEVPPALPSVTFTRGEIDAGSAAHVEAYGKRYEVWVFHPQGGRYLVTTCNGDFYAEGVAENLNNVLEAWARLGR
jgi:hypothetical protein